MAISVEPYNGARLEEIAGLALRAWAPVFESLRESLPPEVFRAFYGDDWRPAQRRAVEAACANQDTRVFVAAESAAANATLAGFVALRLHPEDRMGEIHMIAVDPPCQRRGVATALMRHAENWFRGAGMTIVMVETGGDRGHAPARRAYEAAGYQPFAAARYFKSLETPASLDSDNARS